MIYKCLACGVVHDGEHTCANTSISITTSTPKSFKKFDNGKLRWHLMPIEALEEVVKVFEAGAQKYGDFNWLINADEVEFTRLSNSKERHHVKWKKGQDRDEETNLYELAHDIANALMLLTYQIKGVGIDNRLPSNPKKGGKNE